MGLFTIDEDGDGEYLDDILGLDDDGGGQGVYVIQAERDSDEEEPAHERVEPEQTPAILIDPKGRVYSWDEDAEAWNFYITTGPKPTLEALNGADLTAAAEGTAPISQGDGTYAMEKPGASATFPVTQDLQIERGKSFSSGTQIENLSLSAQGIWRDTLPNREYSNVLPIHRTQFFADLFASDSSAFTQYQVDGSSTVTRSISAGELTFENSSGGIQEEWFTPHKSPDTPFFAASLRVESYSESWNSGGSDANPGIGLINSASDWLTVAIDPAGGEVVVYENWGGSGSSLLASTTEPTLPTDLLAIVIGNKVHVLTRPVETSKGWTYHGSASWSASSKDLFDDSQRANVDVAFNHRLDDGESVTISDFRMFMTPMFGIRDPAPVTYRDGAPFTRGDWVYIVGSCAGGTGIGDSYQGVFRLNTESYDVEFTGAICGQPGNGSTYNDYAGHIVYDEADDRFIVQLSGWAQREAGNISSAEVFVGETTDDVLHGVNVIDVSNMGLPDPKSDDVYDPYLIYDSDPGAWRCAHNTMHREIAVSETTDDPASGDASWSILNTRDESGTSTTIEGPKIQKIDGEYALTYADDSAGSGAVSTDYPDPAANVESVSFDVDPGYSKPHCPILPIYENGETVYYALSFDGAGYQGKGDYTHGNLMIYRADQTATGYEFPTRSVYR